MTKVIDGGFNEKGDFGKMLVAVKAELDQYLEWVQVKAQVQKAAYDALIKEGFNEQQALELCKEVV